MQAIIVLVLALLAVSSAFSVSSNVRASTRLMVIRTTISITMTTSTLLLSIKDMLTIILLYNNNHTYNDILIQ